MQDNYELEVQVALTAIKQAVRLAQSVQRSATTDVLFKQDRSPATVADFGSQALICRQLAKAFPTDPVIAEEDSTAIKAKENSAVLERVTFEVDRIESVSDPLAVCEWIDRGETRYYSDRFWTLDPIDGTKGFLRGEQYAISLALIVEGQVRVGLLACPRISVSATLGTTGAVLIAVRGQGAAIQSLELEGERTQLRVSATANPAHAKFCESIEPSHSSHSDAQCIAAELGISAAPLRLDSQAKYATVARGEVDIYVRLPRRLNYRERIWDHAAGMLVVAEAGGQVTDIHGRPIEFTHGSDLSANRGIVATNGHLHARVLTATRRTCR